MKSSANFRKAILLILLFFIFLEITGRLFFSTIFQHIVLTPKDSFRHFYKVLEQLDFYEYDEDGINILVLGGSVVYEFDMYYVNDKGEEYFCKFCDVKKYLPDTNPPFRVLNLSNPGHNMYDSWIKYSLLKNSRFDYIFIYHGINDTRTNNIHRDLFDENYRHVEFYDDLYVVLKHKNDILILPFFFDWILHIIEKKTAGKNYIEKAFDIYLSLDFEKEELPVFEDGGDIKSKQVFAKNLNKIYQAGKERNQQIIISTFAHYSPDNYTLKRFYNWELDYGQPLFPTEMFGSPENVVKGIEVHNEVVRSFVKSNQDVLFFDLESKVPKSKEYFNDICHLAQPGCVLMGEELKLIIRLHEKFK